MAFQTSGRSVQHTSVLAALRSLCKCLGKARVHRDLLRPRSLECSRITAGVGCTSRVQAAVVSGHLYREWNCFGTTSGINSVSKGTRRYNAIRMPDFRPTFVITTSEVFWSDRHVWRRYVVIVTEKSSQNKLQTNTSAISAHSATPECDCSSAIIIGLVIIVSE
jgi:hypothetical protein